MLFIGKGFKNEYIFGAKHPIIYKHLICFKDILMDKRLSLKENVDQWFTLNRGTAHSEIFSAEKIVCPQRSSINCFGYNDLEWYAASDVFFITNPQTGVYLKYILALLNSKLYYFWLYNKGKRKGNNLELTAKPLKEIPILIANEADQKKILRVIDNIIKAKRLDPSADTTADEQEIDRLVYHLYGLTYDEVKIVDPETTITEEEYNNGLYL